MAVLRVSHVPHQSHVVITHPEVLGSSLVLRIPESVKSPDEADVRCPGNVVWEEVSRETHLRYHWDEDEAVKAAMATDFSGEVRSGDDEITFDVTMRNAGDRAQGFGVFLFCLQAGANHRFHDHDGVRTFVRLADRWVTVNEMQGGVFEDHRMCGYATGGGEGEVAHNLMAKTGDGSDWVLGMALDQPGHVSCNHQMWPSCIHANPKWRELAPGESETAHGKVYYFRGDLDMLYERYRRDFDGA